MITKKIQEFKPDLILVSVLESTYFLAIELLNSVPQKDRNYKRALTTAIVTARNAPAHERVITTLEDWGVSANEMFFLGGMEKDRILSKLKPHMFFDDQKSHLESKAGDIPMVHIPFGIANVQNKQAEAEAEAEAADS